MSEQSTNGPRATRQVSQAVLKKKTQKESQLQKDYAQFLSRQKRLNT